MRGRIRDDVEHVKRAEGPGEDVAAGELGLPLDLFACAAAAMSALGAVRVGCSTRDFLSRAHVGRGLLWGVGKSGHPGETGTLHVDHGRATVSTGNGEDGHHAARHEGRGDRVTRGAGREVGLPPSGVGSEQRGGFAEALQGCSRRSSSRRKYGRYASVARGAENSVGYVFEGDDTLILSVRLRRGARKGGARDRRETPKVMNNYLIR